MAIQAKYLNPFTDFGFKKLFGSEPNKDLLIDFLNQLLPPQHQIRDLSYVRSEMPGDTRLDRGAVFDIYCKLLEAAEIGNFNREEMAQYENSLKHYRDNKNVIDTAVIKGRTEKAIEVARNLLRKDLSPSLIAEVTGLSEEEIAALRSSSPS